MGKGYFCIWRISLNRPSIYGNAFTNTLYNLKELATRYPTVKDFWFDGTWDASIKQNGWWTAHVEQMLKEMVPGVTINSRLRADDYGKRHFDSNGHLMGDYESGYERRLPHPVKDLKVTQWDWEACMTVPENQWGYHKEWSLSYVKQPIEVLERIVHAVSMGGNMVVFQLPFSNRLQVKTPQGVNIIKATNIEQKEVKVQEAARNEYQVVLPASTPNEPFVIRLHIENKNQTSDKYRDALT